MTSQIKAKLLQHFAAKKGNKGGFTLIELLVVIIIIGILSAIALPSFLNQANKARASEAKTYVGSMNRGQQAYFLENGNFAYGGAPNLATPADAFSALGLGITPNTENYSYAIANVSPASGGSAVSSSAEPSLGLDPNNQNASLGPDPDASVKQYYGVAKVGVTSTGGDATTLAALCEALTPPLSNSSTMYPETPGNLTSATPGAPTCGTGFKAVQ